jgi:uncharacterized protein
LSEVLASGLVEGELSIVWHAGEPLVLPPAWYDEAFAAVAELVPARVHVRHSFQTNAMLLSEPWCRLILDHAVQVGVSLDGPARLHNARRRTRDGRGTHAAVMRGVRLLQAHGIPFHVICVLTRASLEAADELLDFFEAEGLTQLGFNIEEIEGRNTGSSLTAAGSEALFERFFSAVVERARASGGRLRIREIDAVLGTLRDPAFGGRSGNAQNTRGEIVSISHQGDVGTWSPELLGIEGPDGPFVLGNLHRQGLTEILAGERSVALDADIRAGIDACRACCPYFAFCGGGAPANKLAECGSLRATETMFCRLTQKIVVETVLQRLDRDLPQLCA